MQFDKQEFVFNHHISNTPYIKTQIGLFKMNNGVSLDDDLDKFGRYILDTDPEGNHFDD